MALHDETIEQRATLLDAWVQKRREIARLEAEAAELLADRMRVHDADVKESPYHRDSIWRSMIAEYCAAGHISKTTMENAFTDAAFLDSTHIAVRESFRRGEITATHAHAIIEAGEVVREAVRKGRVDEAAIGVFDIAALVVAEHDTPARTRAQVRQIAASLVGETVVERQKRAASERTVTRRSVGDGLALLQIVLPEYLVEAIFDRLTALARDVIAARDDQEPVLDPEVLDDGPDPIYPEDLAPDHPALADPVLGDHAIFGEDGTFVLDPDTVPAGHVEHVPSDDRTMDQLRADLVTDLLLAGSPHEMKGTGVDNIQGHIQVTVSATTLLGADDRSAELDGHGPLDPDVARDLAGRNTGWTRLFLDPTGMVTEVDTYTPTAGMRRFLRARDQRCRFPGCRMPARRCQIDHNHDHAKGGRTALCNLCLFCSGHHPLKHPDVDERHRWTARLLPDGTVEWTSPLGRTYTDPPSRRVMFV